MLSLLGLVGLGAACTPNPVGFEREMPCDEEDSSDRCDTSCVDTACPAGSYCGADGTCSAECNADHVCPDGLSCSSDGQCREVSEVADAAVPQLVVDAQPVDDTCASVMFTGTRVTPNVILVIDRSGSMNWPFEGSVSRWDTLESSLLATPDGLIHSMQSSVRFGIAMYDNPRDTCPNLVPVAADTDNYDAIETEYTMRSPGGDTPTGDSIRAITGMLDTLAPESDDPTIFVLCTDGEPDTCEDPDDEVNGRLEAIAAVQEAYAASVSTYVISVGTGIAESHLQDVANAGVGRPPGDPDAPYWVATDTTGLQDALQTIVGNSISCTLELDGQVMPEQACMGSVTLGREELECGTDWRTVDETHIELLGEACTQLQTTNDTLEATFPCHTIIY